MSQAISVIRGHLRGTAHENRERVTVQRDIVDMEEWKKAATEATEALDAKQIEYDALVKEAAMLRDDLADHEDVLRKKRFRVEELEQKLAEARVQFRGILTLMREIRI